MSHWRREPENMEPYDFGYCLECGGRDNNHEDDEDGYPCPAQN